MDTTVVLDAQSHVVGSSYDPEACGAPQRSAAGSSQHNVDISSGHRQSNGLVYSSDGSVVGSCVPVVAAGLAVVSTSGDIIGDISEEGMVTSGAGKPPESPLHSFLHPERKRHAIFCCRS